MKYFLILILVGFVTITSTNMVYGMWFPQSPEELFEQSETVFVGTVVIVNELEFERSTTHYIEENGVTRIEIENYTQTLDEYTVNIEEFLKNPQTSNTITMLEATVSGVPGRSVSIGGFELGDRVLFYVPKIDGTNQYSPESFKIPEQCDVKSVLEQSRVFLFNDFKIMQDGVVKNDNFVANKPIEFVYNKDMDTLEGNFFDVNIKISKIIRNDWEPAFDKQIHTESNPCEWTSTASWEFVPTAGRYYMWMNITEGDNVGVETSSRGFTVKEFDFPLKQIKSGVALTDILCSNEKSPAYKYNRMRVACVSDDALEKLWNRGWATMRFTEEDISPHALCNNYDGKWHPEYEGCRDITDLQCSLMGGEFVDDLKICYDGVCPADKTYTLCVTNPDLISREEQDENQSLSVVKTLLSQNHIDYSDKLVITSGPTIRGDPGCGAVVDTNSQTHWFGIDSISEPQKITLYHDNPNQCEVNTASCFCNAQRELTTLTLDELSYFTLQEEEKCAKILIEYLDKENINRTPKFQIGKLNLNYTDSSAVGYCGELWGTNTYDFFEGAFVNDVTVDYSIHKELSPLCAISDDAKWWEKK